MSHETNSDGVIKYCPHHITKEFRPALASICSSAELPEFLSCIHELNEARTMLHDLNLIGISPSGTGFGNLSFRLTDTVFAISGSGTGGPRLLGENGYALVSQVCLEKNEVHSAGPVPPSSEAMTHAAVYAALSDSLEIRCVIHVHSQELFTYYLPHAPHTPVSAAYGTPELALAVHQLILSLNRENGFLVLAGHQDGLVFFGDTIEHTMKTIHSAMSCREY